MDFYRISDILDYQQKRYPQRVAMAGRENGKWRTWSTTELIVERDCISAGLLEKGIHHGDRIGILAHCGSPQWVVADAAMLQIGVVPVPIHATARPDEIAHIVKDAALRGCFVSSGEMMEKLQEAGVEMEYLFLLENVAGKIEVAFPEQRSGVQQARLDHPEQRSGVQQARLDHPEQRSGVQQARLDHPERRSGVQQARLDHPEQRSGVPWNELACEPDEHLLGRIQYFREGIRPEDIATILYTSGTTGLPKGVVLSHANIVSNVKSVLAIVPVGPETITVSFLPLSHIFERMVTYTYEAAGVPIWFADSIERLPKTLMEVRPHFFTAVPRVLERIYERLLEERDKRGKLQKKILDWAIALGERFPYSGGGAMPLDYRLKRWVADVLVFRKWRKRMGGRVRYIAVGAAALQPRLGRLFSAASIDVREGYGLTETSPVISFNRFEPGGVHFGTVGIPAPGVEVRIATEQDDAGNGEIEVRGANVMSGYLHLPEETAERFTPDGWFKTGDVGRFEFKRFLKITGRKSEIFKTTTGKFVAPAFVEQQLLNSHYISQCMVVGLNRPFVGALIIPNFHALETWCNENKVHWTAPQFMVLNPKVEKLFQQEIERINNERLGTVERVRVFHLLHEEWSPENGFLTPTLKIRRDRVADCFSEEIEKLFV